MASQNRATGSLGEREREELNSMRAERWSHEEENCSSGDTIVCCCLSNLSSNCSIVSFLL